MAENDNDFREVIDGEPVDEKPDTKPTDDKDSGTDEKKDGYEDVCYICRRPESVAGKMIHIPGDLSICSDCMQKTFDSMKNFPFGGDNSGSNLDLSSLQPLNFFNIKDLMGGLGGVPESQKVKKKGEKEGEDGDDTAPAEIDIRNMLPPHEIKAKLDEYVVGQEHAKKVMSVAVYNHYKRVFADEHRSQQDDGVTIEKSNMLMIGPTGSGKTYLVKTLARLLDVPLAITDATSLTEAGYIGDDIESVVSKLLAAAGNDVEKAEYGIIFIDEIDKLAKKRNANQRDVSGEAVQQGMLKLLEGSRIEVPVGASSKNAMVPMTMVDTSNILFICGGAFPDLSDIIKERLNKSSAMGFVSDLKDKYDDDENILEKVTVEDLRKFGMIPEFIGRIPVITSTRELREEDLVDILTRPKNALVKQYRRLFEIEGVDLEFTPEALNEIARQAIARGTGARGLRAICESTLQSTMFDLPSDLDITKVIVTKECVGGTEKPEVVRQESLLPKHRAS